MMHPENPLFQDKTIEQKRTLLFAFIRENNKNWTDSIREEVKYYKNLMANKCVSTYGAPLVINKNMAANLKITVSHYEDYVTPDPDVLLSEKIPQQLVFDHPDNKDMQKFSRMLVRRDILSELGFSSSRRDEPITNIPWEIKKYTDERSKKEVTFFIAVSQKDPKVFLTRTLYPPKENNSSFLFVENLWVAENKETAITAREETLAREIN
jgi:hypothetical protein